MKRHFQGIQVALFVGFMLLLSAAAVPGLLHWSAPADPTLLNGHLAKSIETQYDKDFPIKTLGTNLWAAFDLLLFHEGRPGVELGRDGWLFTDEEFKPIDQGEAHLQQNLQLVMGVRDALAKQGSRLLVAVVPAKARVYAEYVAAEKPSQQQRSLLTRMDATLDSTRVDKVDLLPVLLQAKRQQPVFLHTDTHWTPFGAAQAAAAIARHVRNMPGLELPNVAFVTEAQPSQPHKGDLLSYLPLDPWFADLLPAADQLAVPQTHIAASSPASEGLFGDSEPEVALVGTSYSANLNWNFPGALKQALGSDLINYAEEGKGPILPMLKYLSSKDFRDSPPALVIWEFPERYLPVGYDLSQFDAGWVASLQQAGAADLQAVESQSAAAQQLANRND